VLPALVLGTANPGKVEELRALFGGLGYAIRSLADHPGVRLPPEGTESYAANARAKARTAATGSGAVAVGDDSGLEVDALAGGPGVASARYGGPGLTDDERTARLLAALGGTPVRTACFRCVLALAAPWGEEALVEGVTEGEIGTAPRGHGGFGYDPIFLLPGLGRTLAELSPEEKAVWSHRGRAARAARPILAGWAAQAARRG
jgi:XTP/dITP diphosphohydrolase